ncbi:MFS transporter [Clostridia bacterium]|nr:MFS transporter [Clostridia bacterium]
MSRKNAKSIVSVVEAYGMYLITGISCTCVGAVMMMLTDHFGKSVAQIAALTSAFAFGRVIMVFFCGIITEKFGPKLAFAIGLAATTVNLLLMPINTNYWIAMVLMALAGVGMGFQDSGCPVVLSGEFPVRYSSAMSAGQAFFGAGCFLPPLAMSVLLSQGLSWKLMYYTFGSLALVLLIGVFFMANNYHTTEEARQKKTGILSVFIGKGKFAFWLFFGVFFYVATQNVVHTYTNAFLIHFGVADTVAVNVLTMYSVGAMVGSILFIPILRRTSPQKVMCINSIATLVSFSIAMLFPGAAAFFICFTVAGLFSGVLFSVFITIATQDAGQHKAIMASLVGLVGGATEIVTPLLTGQIINATSVAGAFWYNEFVMVLTVISAFALYTIYKRKSELLTPSDSAKG